MLEQVSIAPPRAQQTQTRSWAIAITSFTFILLQSACAAFVALSGLRLVVGVGSLALATAGFKFLAGMHADAIRVPMEGVAIVGSVMNLFAIHRVRRLRERPSAQWRLSPVTPKQRHSESAQLAIAVLTLALVAVEWGIHIFLHGTV